jgi:hypothetical protein
MIMDDDECRAFGGMAGETVLLGEKRLLFRFVHHKSHMT